jgi:hypothetical protein
MSDSSALDIYGKPITFQGEMPLPEPVGSSDPGISNLKANADHVHDFEAGGKNTPWFNVSLAGGWVWFGGTARVPQYCRVGSLGIIRGVVTNGVATGPLSVVGTIPTTYAPISGREIWPIITGGPTAIGQLELLQNGQLQYTVGPAALTIVFGTLIYNID